ncbi:energy-coupling factor ABC transporter substrate-binding protein [Candidatus Pyrohabitans sp.]
MRLGTVFLLMLLLPLTLAEEPEPWSGADALAEQKIVEITGGEYEPWFSPIWEPPSSEIETFLFSLQAAVGALVIGYFVGYFKGIKEGRRRTEAR